MYNTITNLFNIDKNMIEVLEVRLKESTTYIHITLLPQYSDCPICGANTISNGFAINKTINHPILRDRNCFILYKSRRRKCTECSSTFSEANPFSFAKFKTSYEGINLVMKELINLNLTYSYIAKSHNMSITQVQNYLDSFVTIPRQKLPVNIGIDEIHSKMAKRTNSSYLCVLVDNENRYPFEILPSRSKRELSLYFDKIPLEERNGVKYWTMDMWQPYKDVALKYLKNCTIAVDPFHVVSHLTDAFRRIRLNIMKQVEYKSDAYYLLKSCKDLIEKNIHLDNKPRFNNHFKQYLNRRDLQNMIFDISDTIKIAYELKEMYLRFNKEATIDNSESWLQLLIDKFLEADIPEYYEFIKMVINWRQEILNSFERPYENRKQSNALAENINGKIKRHIVVSNGITNFSRFRKRVLYALNPRIHYSISNRLK